MGESSGPTGGKQPQTAMERAAAEQQQKVATLRGLFEASRKQIEMALPSHMTADRMIRLAMTSIQKTPKLLECDPRSVIGAVIQSAQLGLECDGATGQAHLVPYKNRKKNRTDCQLIPGYKGYLKLARNSGALVDTQAQVVKKNDVFEYQFGTDPRLVHKPAIGNRGETIAAYVVFGLSGGGRQFDVMSRDEIELVRARSRNSGESTPWASDFDEMAKKTVLRRGSKLVPQSVEKDGVTPDRLALAASLEERAIAGRSQHLAALADPGFVAEEDDEEGAGDDDKPEPPTMPRRASEAAPAAPAAPASEAVVDVVAAPVGSAADEALALEIEEEAARFVEETKPAAAPPPAPPPAASSKRSGPTAEDPLLSDTERRGLVGQALKARVGIGALAVFMRKRFGIETTEELTTSEALIVAAWLKKPAGER